MSEKENVKDKVFTIDGLKKEFHRIKWPMLRGEDGALRSAGSVLLFAGIFALFFIGTDWLSAVIVRFLG